MKSSLNIESLWNIKKFKMHIAKHKKNIWTGLLTVKIKLYSFKNVYLSEKSSCVPFKNVYLTVKM